MPKYAYRCSSCDKSYEIVHGMSEEIDNTCECGEEETLVRVPSASFTFISKREKGGNKVGSVVNESIQSARQELKEQKAEAEREFE